MTPEDFIVRMTVLYGPPDTVDEQMFLDEYRDILRGNVPTLIKRAGDIIRDTQTRRGWPTPGEVREAIQKAAYDKARYTPPEHRPFERAKPPTPEELAAHEMSKARVDQLAKAFIAAGRVTGAKKAHPEDSSRERFEEMQRNSPNRYHRTR